MDGSTVGDRAERLGQAFTSALLQGHGTNDLLHRFLEAIAEILGSPRVVLHDYDERTDAFDLLYFQGYPDDARSGLRTDLLRIDPGRAKSQREPYAPPDAADVLCVPLYFQDTLEALLVLERGAQEALRSTDGARALLLVSRFLGLFLSSSRLPVNQRAHPVSSADLERAREVQLSYLPRNYAVTERYEIYGYNQSAALVGGDYFDYFCGRPESIQFVVADACGHGLAATLTMCTFRGMLHASVEHAAELASLFDALNRRLYVEADHLQYLTGIFCDYDQSQKVLRYFNAGHFAPILVRGDGAVERLPGRGRPLGMFSDSTYEMQSWPIASGDLLVLYTDGLFELRDVQEEYFGVDGILSAVLEHRGLSLRELGGKVLSSAARFSHSAQPDDDITLFLVRFL